MKILKVGILGAGNMGRVHAQRLSRMNRVEIDAICSKPLESAHFLSNQITGGRALCYDSFKKMIKERNLDVLYVCMPPFAHNGQVELAAKNGIHLFLEKPIALTVKRAQSMVNAIENAGIISQVGYHFRFGAAVKQLKKMIDNGSAGKPTLFQARYFCNSLHSDWWRNVSLSGGQIFEQVIHVYDMAFYLFGKIKTVTAFADNLCHKKFKNYTVEDTSVSSILFRSGAMGSIVASNCAVPREWRFDFRVVCEKVTLDFSSANEAKFIFTQAELIKEKLINKVTDLRLEETKSFIAAVRGKKDTIAPARDGLEGVKIVTAVAKSAKSNGKCVRLA